MSLSKDGSVVQVDGEQAVESRGSDGCQPNRGQVLCTTVSVHLVLSSLHPIPNGTLSHSQAYGAILIPASRSDSERSRVLTLRRISYRYRHVFDYLTFPLRAR